MISPPDTIGKYQIQGILGQGGMGVVYRGYDQAIARSVAIKAISKAILVGNELGEVLGRFRHEAQAVGRLVHPRIVQIYDYGEDAHVAYIVMELVNGITLQQHLARGDSYDIAASAEIVRQLLDGLGHAHEAGVIHRDIKPANILVNSDGRIKISDFGIARTEASGLTQAGDVLGTLHYMSPEQFTGIEVDNLSDLYSVAVIAYELLAGKKPFSGNAATLMRQVLSQLPERPSLPNPGLSPLIDRVLLKALSKSREDRYQSAREFAEALKEGIDASLALAGTLPAAASISGAALLSAARLLVPGATTAAAASNEVPAGLDLTAFDATSSAIKLDNHAKKARVLFIDDEERILTALKSQFRERYHVFTTTDPNKALDFIGKFQTHVIVSDQRMPEMVGVELLRRSRANAPNSVRILLTGYSDLASIVGSINDGEVYRFISKPWDTAELQRVIAEATTIGLEMADAKAAAADLPARIDSGVMVIDPDEAMVRVVRELLGSQCPVWHALDLDAALELMKQEDVAVLVADVEFGAGQITEMLKIVKQINPQLLAIVATQASDSELVIELINQAQIFRFLNKPVNVKVLRGHLHAALARYLSYQAAPVLLQAQKVDVIEVAERVQAATLGQKIFESLRSLRMRWQR